MAHMRRFKKKAEEKKRDEDWGYPGGEVAIGPERSVGSRRQRWDLGGPQRARSWTAVVPETKA